MFYLGRPHQFDRPHNVPLVLLGAGILWFGFNAGSGGSAGTVAVAALVNIHPGACVGMDIPE